MTEKLKSLEALYIDQLKDLYDAEHQLMEALPKMVDAASSQDLKTSFQKHLGQTREQAKRLEQIFSERKEQPGGKTCMGMQGLVKEGEHLMNQKNIARDVLDAGLIAAAQKIEHYEIASYGTVRTYADTLGFHDHARLLDRTLEEEAKTNEKLTALAESHINVEAGTDM